MDFPRLGSGRGGAAGGALQELSSTEEDYLAYRAGIHMGQMATTDVSAITLVNDPSHRNIGTYVDTYYNQGVGPTPDAYAEPPVLSTSTNVYQITGDGGFVPSNLRKNPICWWTTYGGGLKTMNDTELDAVVDRLVKKIMADELPGTFRLSDTSPGADYVEFIPAVFTDTRGDGFSNDYSIWLKTDGTPIGDRVAPITVERTAGAYSGIRAMTQPEVDFTFGERAKAAQQTSGIGEYQLRSATQGAPTDAGTWVARGTAIDTRLTFVDGLAYTGPIEYTQFYVPDLYTATYTGTYIGEYGATYVAEYISEYGGEYT